MIIERIKIFNKEFMIITTTIICIPFLFFILLQIMNSESLHILIFSQLIISNILPISIVILFLFYERGNFGVQHKRFFEIYEDGIIRIPEYSIFLSIFESNSFQLINNKGLNQLIDLEPFSLEIDGETKSLRVYLFSKSKKDQLHRIIQALPLLEATFPDLQLMTSLRSKKFFMRYSIVEIAGFSLIQEKGNYLIPALDPFPTGQYRVQNKVILAYNSSRKDRNLPKDNQTTQVYALPKYNGTHDFNLIGNIILNCYSNPNVDVLNKNILMRAIIRFQLNNSKLISFNEGISYFQKILMSFQVISESNVYKNISKDELNQINSKIESENPVIIIEKEDVNIICLELCNIHNNLEIDENRRLLLCQKRVDFCRKLANNRNFLALLMELARKDDEQRKSQILGDLLVHLSFHQLYCLISQFISTYEEKDLIKISMMLLHALISEQVKSGSNRYGIKLDIQKSRQDDQRVDCNI